MAQASESQPDRSTNSLAWFGIGQFGIGFIHLDMLLHAAQLAEFGLDHDAFGMRSIHDALGDCDILLERLAAGIDHDRGIETALDAVVAGGLVAVVQVDGEDGIREDLVGRTDQAFEHGLVGERTGAFADLDDEGSLAVHVAAEQAHGLLQVVDIIGSDGILAIGRLKQLLGGNDHFISPYKWIMISSRYNPPHYTKSVCRPIDTRMPIHVTIQQLSHWGNRNFTTFPQISRISI